MSKRQHWWLSLRAFLLGMGVMYVFARYRHRGELQWVQQLYEDELHRYVPFGRRRTDNIVEVPDDEIAATVPSKLEEGGIVVDNLFVRVKNGVVTLHGEVLEDNKGRVAAILGQIPGVRGVQIYLAVPASGRSGEQHYH